MSSLPSLNIFFTGASGYIGGTVLQHLLQSNVGQRAHVSAIVRPSKQNAAVIEQLRQHKNVEVVEGSHDDFDLVSKHAEAADVVIHTANSADDVPSAKGILAGLSKPLAAGRGKRFYMHTSGTGELIDNSKGMFAAPDSEIYSDLDFARFDALPPETYHRDVTQLVFDGARQHADTFEAVVIAPPTIYGQSSGFGKKVSQQILTHVQASLAAKHGRVVGKGAPLWESVHVDDLAELYLAILHGWLSHKVSTVKDGGGLYFAATGTFAWIDVATAVAKELHRRGAIDSDDVQPLSDAEIAQLGGDGVYKGIGSNSRCKSERADKEGLGWQPKHINAVLSSVPGDVDYTLKEQQQKQ